MGIAPDLPVDEQQRLDAVRRYDILDTPPDGAFDRVTALAARICHVPIATITIVDTDRIWFKSAHGISVDEIGREPGLCASAIIGDVPHVVTDAINDPRTLDNPLVRGELGLRFYVGIPLVTEDGHSLGTLNIIDSEPREVTDDELATLTDLARIVMDELELRLMARRTIEIEATREAAEFRSSLLAGVSHEMRTAISVLHGTLDLDGEDEAERDRLRNMQRRHVRRLAWLVNQFLDFTAIEAGRLPTPDDRALDLADLARDTADLFGSERVGVEIGKDVPQAIGDDERTSQILVELTNNAIRFSPDGAPVTIHAHEAGPGQVAVSVTDEGPGIHPDDHDRVFEKVYRAGMETGSGIGLFVSRALAEAQGGDILLESAPGEGSTFTLVLPAAH